MSDKSESGIAKLMKQWEKDADSEFQSDIAKMKEAGLISLEIIRDCGNKEFSHLHVDCAAVSKHIYKPTPLCFATVDSLLAASHDILAAGRAPVDSNPKDHYRDKELRGSVNTWLLLKRR